MVTVKGGEWLLIGTGLHLLARIVWLYVSSRGQRDLENGCNGNAGLLGCYEFAVAVRIGDGKKKRDLQRKEEGYKGVLEAVGIDKYLSIEQDQLQNGENKVSI